MQVILPVVQKANVMENFIQWNDTMELREQDYMQPTADNHIFVAKTNGAIMHFS